MTPHVVVVVGTRPELVKMAGVIRSLKESLGVETTTVFTGQHAALMDAAAQALSVEPDVSLEPLPTGRSLTDLLANIVRKLGDLLNTRGAACVVVQGDTVSSFAGAMVSELLAIPLIHIEAGVRSGLRDDPFPEETIRRMISPITELHVCFSDGTRQNLLEEGVDAGRIVLAPHPLRERVGTLDGWTPSRYGVPRVLITLHRRERRVQRAERLLELLARLEARCALAATFVWHPSLELDLVHIRERLESLRVEVVAPLPPDEFLEQLATAALVITDSAGVAEEAQLLGRPLIAFRASAESRIDEAPLAPECTTELVDVAEEFAIRNLAEPPQQLPHPAPAASSGRVIASSIVSFLEQQRQA